MSNYVYLNHGHVATKATSLAAQIVCTMYPSGTHHTKRPDAICLYGVPRGGIPAAYVVQSALRNRADAKYSCIVDKPEDADFIIDDIIDSGATREKFARYEVPFLALYDKTNPEDAELGWLVFPWESTLEGSIEDHVVRILEFIGEDAKREGLLETPKRVVKSWHELFRGYKQDPESVFKTFDAESCDQLVLLKDIEMYSMCEHHMLPFVGKAHIAYIPSGKVIGVSKLARLMDIYSRRLQIQERIGEQITTALMQHLSPLGAACIIEAKHLCMSARGANKQHSVMITSSLKGVYRHDAAARSELMQLIKS